ncbi:hypothetical protein Lal_00033914 [Lupinus albus]|nr:hypothetical protein Lal_00033914 [Lupinus albus]
MKYQAHINMEWCNQSTSINISSKAMTGSQLLLNFRNGGSQNQANINERIFRFPIHGRQPVLERLFFHLQGEQPVYFNDNEEIENILSRPIISESMFTSWMEANEQYLESRNLGYAQYVSKFVYVKRNRCWKPRKFGYTIGRLIWVPPCTCELYYLRIMLIVVKGPTSYETTRAVSEIQYSTFRDACLVMGLLKDDR